MTCQRGVSLIELVAVITILGIVAAVVIPNLESTNPYRLDTAANELAEAIRFARAESIRTGIPHGMMFSMTNDDAKIYSLPAGTPVYDVYHPVDKKLYSLHEKISSITTGVELQSYSIRYQGVLFNQQYLGFNSYGNPKFNYFGTDRMLEGSAVITLAYAGQTRTVSVSPMTGRVTVQ